MKITFDTENQGMYNNTHVFFTQEEWDNHPGSIKYMSTKWKWGTYQPAYYTEPFGFPCICFDGPIISNPNGADWICATFLYNFTIEKEPEDTTERDFKRKI